MKKRINSTGRQRLSTESVAIRLIEPQRPGEARSFTATLILPASLADKPEASVYIESYVKSSAMRFSYGTVGALTPPTTTILSELDPGPVLFRLRVVDDTPGLGRILAAADRISPQEEIEDGDSRKSLLPLVQRDLGERIWAIELIGGTRPMLVINNRVPAIRDRLMTDPIMQGAVFPHAVRHVFEALFADEEIYEEAGWVADWFKFGADLLGHELPEDLDPKDDSEEIDRLVDEIVETFCSARAFARKAQEREESIQ